MGEEKLVIKITEDGVYHNGNKIKLTDKPFDILKYLIKNPGKQSFIDIDKKTKKNPDDYKMNDTTISQKIGGYKGKINTDVFCGEKYIINERKYLRFENIEADNIILDIQLKEEIPSEILATRNAIANYYWKKCRYNTMETVQYDTVYSFVIPPILVDKKISISGDEKEYLIKAPNSYGKSTLLKNILLSANYSAEVYYNQNNIEQNSIEKIRQIRNYISAEDNKRYLALFINSNDISDRNDKNDIAWLYQMGICESESYVRLDEFKRVVEFFQNRDRLIVLVDGLDEVEQDRRNKIKDKLKTVLKEYPNTRFVVATRPILEDIDNFFNEYRLLKIEPLESNQRVVNEYVQRYANGDNDISTLICDNHFLRNFVTTPYMLSTVILALRIRENEKGIYPVIKTVIEKQMPDRFVSNKDNIDKRNKRLRVIKRIYQNIAFEMAKSGLSYFQNDDKIFTEIIENINKAIVEDNNQLSGLYGEDPSKIANDIYTHHSLLVTTEGIIKFIAHKVAVPYFTAGYLTRIFIREYQDKVKNDMSEDAMMSSTWHTFEMLNSIREDYICDTVSFLLVIMLERDRDILDSIGTTESDLFLCIFAHFIEQENCNDKVTNNLKSIFEAVFSDEILGLDDFKSKFEEITGKRVDELIR